MKLHIFQSDKGDCLLLESKDGRRILCDGGMASSMREHVRGELAKLRDKGDIDYAYVSHIDSDHISGVLQLLQDELEWRVYDQRRKNGHAKPKRPKVPRPPRIGGIWHNAFRDLAEDNDGDIESMLAASAPVYRSMQVASAMQVSEAMSGIATSIPEALKVSRLVSPELLGIPLNRLPGGNGPARLLFFRKQPQRFKLGSLAMTIVGPTKDELDDLRTGWNNWLAENRDTIAKIRAEMKRKVDEFSAGAAVGSPFDLGAWNGVPDYKGVTPPNIASLMFMVEEDGKRLLLTGDSQQDIILKGLKLGGYLDDGHLHLDVLKVQHHGSENNVDANFCRVISADDYVFCGNGEHGNPEPEVLQQIYASRLGDAALRALAPKARNRAFTFWFSTSSDLLKPGSNEKKNFLAVEKLVAGMVAKSKGKMKAKFNTGAKLTLTA